MANELPTLYRHVKRPDWGFAILASEGPSRRHFQFQDGRLRTIKKGFYGLVEEVDELPRGADSIIEELNDKLRVARARGEVEAEAQRTGRTFVTFDDQLAVFVEFYPGGFQDPAWLEKVRGQGDERPLKRHRDRAIGQAQEQLARERLDELLEVENFPGVRDAVLQVMRSTDLVSVGTDLAPIEKLGEENQRAFALALRDVLHGDDAFGERFDRFIEAVPSADDQGPTWPMVTVLPALVHPTEHVCVKPSVFREQARWLAPDIHYQTRPRATLYERFRNLALDVQQRLRDAQQEPRDLLDVRDFIWTTLRPKAKKRIAELRRR